MQGRYTNNTSRFTLYQKYNYAFRNYYSDDINRDPVAIQPNSFFCLIAKDAGKAVIDWGDGSIEEFDFVETNTGTYLCAFRSLNSESMRGNGNDWSLGNDNTNSPIIPYPNHHYIDDNTDTERKITITCTNKQVNTLSSNLSRFSGFPLIECESMEVLSLIFTKDINEIPFDRIVKMKKLTRLTLSYLGTKLQVMPPDLFDLTDLTILNLSGVFNLENPESSNLRLIGKLGKLTELNLWNCEVSKYIREFKNLTLLNRLWLSSNLDNAPSYDEITEINQSLTYYYNVYATGTIRTEWDDLSGKGADKIWGLDCWDSQALRVDILPEYIKEMRAIASFNMGQAVRTQERADTFVNTLYNYITNWDQITMSSLAKDGRKNQFYNLAVTIYSSSYQADKRPTGIYQAPNGFVEGSNNGNPISPMEKIYVLTKNYKQTWTVRPEPATLLLRTLNTIPEGYYLDNSVVYSEDDPVYNNEVKLIETIHI